MGDVTPLAVSQTAIGRLGQLARLLSGIRVWLRRWRPLDLKAATSIVCVGYLGLCHTTKMAERPAGLESILASLQSDWRGWLRSRHRRLAALHQDLIQQASADLLEWLGKREELPSEEDVRRVGFTVLARRAMDAYREEVKRWSQAQSEEREERPEPIDPGPESAFQYAQLLRAITHLLSQMPREDRELILRDELLEGSDDFKAMTARERQRLHRLRQELRSKLLLMHQIDIDGP